MNVLGRKGIRFESDENPFVGIDLSLDEEFNPEFKALAVNESHKGVGLVAKKNERLSVDTYCRVQVGFQSALGGKIVWRKDLDEELIRLGIEYVE